MDDVKREALLKARADREKAREDEQRAHDDLVLELEDKYETSLGPRGRAFQIANEDNACGEGPIVVKTADFANYKRWQMKDGDAPEDAIVLLRTCVVYPEPAAFESICGRRPHLIKRAVSAVIALAGVSAAARQGKP